MQLRVRLVDGKAYSLTQQYFVFLGVRKFPCSGSGVNDGLEPPALNLWGLRLDLTTKYAMWAFGMGIVPTLIQTDRGKNRSPESLTAWHPRCQASGMPLEAGVSSSPQSLILPSVIAACSKVG